VGCQLSRGGAAAHSNTAVQLVLQHRGQAHAIQPGLYGAKGRLHVCDSRRGRTPVHAAEQQLSKRHA
jgi:hypothetical protein